TLFCRPLWLPLLSAALLCLAALASAEPAREEAANPPKTAEAKGPATPRFPPGTILAVYDSLADALRMVPRAYVLSPDQYHALLTEIARLRQQLDRPKISSPSAWAVKGKMDGNLVELSVQYDFETTRPGELVRLGCGLAQATGVSLDSGTPLL